MDKREVLEKLRKFSEIVVEKYNPLKIVLFGSYAKGTNKEESDIDVAVIVDKIDGSFLEKEAGLYKIRRNIDENIEPVLFEAGSDKSGFLESILSYGEVIYQR
ncbi:MAG TPA: nucleotidyltransferase domain-containing protein [bacterium]|nr:nucleotidyltransferase domain-containing protein [bacterium]HQN72634.1 nucleotidyltransferase domain-containing protein [bacterium]HQO92140.1 nucleotidyltransferase domain-containing protein [bacterium]